MMHRVRLLVTVIALAAPSLSNLARAEQVAPPPRDSISTFLRQDKYTYCDAKVLAGMWKQSIRDAKSRVGAKLEANGQATLDTQLRAARTAARTNAAARCSFAEAGFTSADAAKLARLWNKTVAEAKTLAEDKMSYGGEANLRALVGKPSTTVAAPDPTSTYLTQDKYTYCDVKVLAAMWRKSISQAKAHVGLKIQTTNTAWLDTELATARRSPKARCNFQDAGLSFADVEKLAAMWKMPVGRAKVRIEQKVTGGGGSFLREQLGGPGSRREQEVAAFLAQHRYTYCDAKMLSGMWKSSIDEAKAHIGFKISNRGEASLVRTVLQARRRAQQDADARCTFHEAGFTYADATRLASVWKTTAAEAKTMVEDKITQGLEGAIRQQLARPTPRPMPPKKS